MEGKLPTNFAANFEIHSKMSTSLLEIGNLQQNSQLLPANKIRKKFSQLICSFLVVTKGAGSSLVILLMYVNDIIIASPSNTAIYEVKQQLQAAFKLKELGPLNYCLGLELAKSAKGIFLSQRKYTLA